MLEVFDLFSLLLQLSSTEQLTWEESSGEKKRNRFVIHALHLVKMALAILNYYHLLFLLFCDLFFISLLLMPVH